MRKYDIVWFATVMVFRLLSVRKRCQRVVESFAGAHHLPGLSRIGNEITTDIDWLALNHSHFRDAMNWEEPKITADD